MSQKSTSHHALNHLVRALAKSLSHKIGDQISDKMIFTSPPTPFNYSYPADRLTRPVTGYQLFLRRKIASMEPTSKQTRYLYDYAAEQWRKLSVLEKGRYSHDAFKINIENGFNLPPDELGIPPPVAPVSSTADPVHGPRGSKRTFALNYTLKSLLSPTRPSSGYGKYVSEQYVEMRKKHPDQQFHQLIPEIVKQWTKLSDVEREVYSLGASETKVTRTRNFHGKSTFFRLNYAPFRELYPLFTHEEIIPRLTFLWKILSSPERRIYADVETKLKAKSASPRAKNYAAFYSYVLHQYKKVYTSAPDLTHVDVMRHLSEKWISLADYERNMIVVDLVAKQMLKKTLPPQTSKKSSSKPTPRLTATETPCFQKFLESFERDAELRLSKKHLTFAERFIQLEKDVYGHRLKVERTGLVARHEKLDVLLDDLICCPIDTPFICFMRSKKGLLKGVRPMASVRALWENLDSSQRQKFVLQSKKNRKLYRNTQKEVLLSTVSILEEYNDAVDFEDDDEGDDVSPAATVAEEAPQKQRGSKSNLLMRWKRLSPDEHKKFHEIFGKDDAISDTQPSCHSESDGVDDELPTEYYSLKASLEDNDSFVQSKSIFFSTMYRQFMFARLSFEEAQRDRKEPFDEIKCLETAHAEWETALSKEDDLKASQDSNLKLSIQ